VRQRWILKGEQSGLQTRTETGSASLCMRKKSLAQNALGKETQNAMSTSGRPTRRGRALVAGFLSVAFLWALALSASPELHQRFHPDANRVEHSCAVTMMASGSYDHVSRPPLVSLPVPIIQSSGVPTLTPQWVESPFLGGRIFEHAPPARS
jgi:hypothetical protein